MFCAGEVGKSACEGKSSLTISKNLKENFKIQEIPVAVFTLPRIVSGKFLESSRLHQKKTAV